ALCRARGIPARLVTGVVLADEGSLPLHSWAEAWVNKHWVWMDPAGHHFGADEFPDSYLVLHLGDGGYRTAQGRDVEVTCAVTRPASGGPAPTSALRSYFRRTSLYTLR